MIRKIALVTGSSRGIGAEIIRQLANANYDVCINYLKNQGAAHELKASLEHLPVKVICHQADVSDEQQVEKLFNTIDKELGPISALINNAGILLPQCKITDITAARVNKLLTTNVTSSFLCSREAIKRMQNSIAPQDCAIVNVSSAAARLGAPFEYIDYAATKGAIDSLTKGLSLEVAELGIRVNGIRPGFIDTDMHADGGEPNRIARLANAIPLKRGGSVEEVANAVVWLLSEKASYITGSTIDIAGGK